MVIVACVALGVAARSGGPASGVCALYVIAPATRGEQVSSAGADLPVYGRVNEPTSSYVWHSVAGAPITDELLDWPPDVFALTNVILERSNAFRFSLSAEGDWPPRRHANWAMAVEEAGRQWSAWAEDRRGAMPDLVQAEWSAFMERADHPIEDLATGRDRRLCEALLTLHAVADEACAGLGVALDTSDGNACGRGSATLTVA